MPKIFIFGGPASAGGVLGYALAEDGTGLAEHYSTNTIYLRSDMGLNSRWKHGTYEAHYPDGYELVDFIDSSFEEMLADPTFAKAYNLNHAEDKDAGQD